MRHTLRNSVIEDELLDSLDKDSPIWRPKPTPVSRVQQRKSQMRTAYLKSTVVKPSWWLTVLSGLPPRQTRMETMPNQPYSIDLIWALEARIYADRIHAAKRDFFPTPFDGLTQREFARLVAPETQTVETEPRTGYDPVAFLGDAEATLAMHHVIHTRKKDSIFDAAAPGASKQHFGYAIDGPGAWHTDSKGGSRRVSGLPKDNLSQLQTPNHSSGSAFQNQQLQLPNQGNQQSRFSHSTKASDSSSSKRYTVPEPLKSTIPGIVLSAQTEIHSAPMQKADLVLGGAAGTDKVGVRPLSRSLSLSNRHDVPLAGEAPHDVVEELHKSPWAEQFGKSPHFAPTKPLNIASNNNNSTAPAASGATTAGASNGAVKKQSESLVKSGFVEEIGKGGSAFDEEDTDLEWDEEEGIKGVRNRLPRWVQKTTALNRKNSRSRKASKENGKVAESVAV